jgi:hypothetical protein
VILQLLINAALTGALTGHLGNGTRFLSGFLIPRFGGWSDIRRFIPLAISEKSECFVRVSSAHFGWPTLRTRTATGINVDDGMRGRMAGTLAISPKRHVVAPAQSYTQSPEKALTSEVDLDEGTLPVWRLHVQVSINNELTRPFWCLIPLGRYRMHWGPIGPLDSPFGVDRTCGARCWNRFMRTGNYSLP